MPQALKEKPQNLPRHIAIIMDGNRRWAAEHYVPRLTGHKKGIEAAQAAVEAALDLGIEYLTLYAFSSENWKRPQDEVDSLMGLLRLYVSSQLDKMTATGVRVKFIGRRDNMPQDIVALLNQAEAKTAGGTKLFLTLAINYGSQDEILDAVKTIAGRIEAGTLKPADITRQTMAEALATVSVPDPDLVIRTGGEKRLSNFLLWQTAYSELIFLDQYWPDFNADLLSAAIQEYQARDRRYGAQVKA